MLALTKAHDVSSIVHLEGKWRTKTRKTSPPTSRALSQQCTQTHSLVAHNLSFDVSHANCCGRCRLLVMSVFIRQQLCLSISTIVQPDQSVLFCVCEHFFFLFHLEICTFIEWHGLPGKRVFSRISNLRFIFGIFTVYRRNLSFCWTCCLLPVTAADIICHYMFYSGVPTRHVTPVGQGLYMLTL